MRDCNAIRLPDAYADYRAASRGVIATQARICCSVLGVIVYIALAGCGGNSGGAQSASPNVLGQALNVSPALTTTDPSGGSLPEANSTSKVTISAGFGPSNFTSAASYSVYDSAGRLELGPIPLSLLSQANNVSHYIAELSPGQTNLTAGIKIVAVSANSASGQQVSAPAGILYYSATQ